MKTIPAKVIVTKTKKPNAWFGCDYTMNIYRGCTHGCIYCDSRSDCYQIDDFDTVAAKENALAIVRNDLSKRRKRGVVATGAMSDPYNPYEKDKLLTRHGLELISAYGYGAAIATKSDLITRDIDVLKEIQRESPVLCKITITSADDALASRIEPGAPSSTERFHAIYALAKAGIFCGILLMPILPFINDDLKNIINLIKMASEMGARFIYPSFGLTLRQGQREYFYRQLSTIFPDENYAEKYRKKYGLSYFCGSPRAKNLWETFAESCNKYKLLFDMQAIIKAYKSSYEITQLSLFN